MERFTTHHRPQKRSKILREGDFANVKINNNNYYFLLKLLLSLLVVELKAVELKVADIGD